MFDGDTVFCLGTGKKELHETEGFIAGQHPEALNGLGNAATDCLARAILQAIVSAESLAGIIAFRDLENL